MISLRKTKQSKIHAYYSKLIHCFLDNCMIAKAAAKKSVCIIPGRYCRAIVSNTGMLVSWHRHICLLLHTRGIWNPETFIVLGLEMHYSLRWIHLRTFSRIGSPVHKGSISSRVFTIHRDVIESLSVSLALLWWESIACRCFLHTNGQQRRALGAVSIRKTVLPGMAIPILKIRRPNGRLIFNMEIAIHR